MCCGDTTTQGVTPQGCRPLARGSIDVEAPCPPLRHLSGDLVASAPQTREHIGRQPLPVGAGPYRFVSFTPGLELTLVMRRRDTFKLSASTALFRGSRAPGAIGGREGRGLLVISVVVKS